MTRKAMPMEAGVSASSRAGVAHGHAIRAACVAAGMLGLGMAGAAAAELPGPRVEIHGLLSGDPLDRRAAMIAMEALAGRGLDLLAAEEAQAAVGADADLLLLLGREPARARALLRRRSGDFVLILEAIGQAGVREEIYGIATWPARIEAAATVLRTLDGSELASTRAVRAARSTRGEEDALESALVQAVRAAARSAEAAILAEAAAWPSRQLLRLEPPGIVDDAASVEAIAARFESRLGRPVDVQASGAALLVTVAPPQPDLEADLAAMGWQVVDRRPGWWVVAAAGAARPPGGPAMEIALAAVAAAAAVSIVLAARRGRRGVC